MQDVTVFLHVSSYAPTPTPVPHSTPSHVSSSSAGGGHYPSSSSSRPYSPATHAFAPPTPSAYTNGNSNGVVGLGIEGPPSTRSLHPSIADDRFPSRDHPHSPSQFQLQPNLGAGPLSRSKSATVGPTPLKLGTMAGGGGGGREGREFRDPPLTALPQNQSFRFG